jgi:hypothetical protein
VSFVLLALLATALPFNPEPVGAASLRPCGAQRHASRTVCHAPCTQTAGGQEAAPTGSCTFPTLQPVGAASLRPSDAQRPTVADARDSVRQVANLPMGDGAVTVGVGKGPIVFVGASSATRTVALAFAPAAVDRFVDDATALLKRGAAPARRHTDDRIVLNDQTSAGSLSFSRAITHHRAAYHFFFSDDPLTGFPLTATPIDVRAMLAALHRAARLTPES